MFEDINAFSGFSVDDIPRAKQLYGGNLRGGGPLIARFTDPAGNVLSVLEQ